MKAKKNIKKLIKKKVILANTRKHGNKNKA